MQSLTVPQQIGILDEIKILQRKSDWTTLPDRYSAVERILVAALKSVSGLGSLDLEIVIEAGILVK